MSKKGKELKGLTSVNIPVPSMLATAIGYQGYAQYVSFQWTPFGDEAEYSDGLVIGTGNLQALLAYIQHPAVTPLLEGYDLGNSDSEAKHALILDRENFKVYIAPVREAERFLKEQWSSEQPIGMSQEEYLAKISIVVKKIKRAREIENIQQRIDEQYALIESMLQWLDKQLKN
jgi:hypothetical protein